MINVFKRSAWTRDKDHPGGYRPCVGSKKHIQYVDTEDRARQICKEYNNNRKVKTDPFCEFEAC